MKRVIQLAMKQMAQRSARQLGVTLLVTCAVVLAAAFPALAQSSSAAQTRKEAQAEQADKAGTGSPTTAKPTSAQAQESAAAADSTEDAAIQAQINAVYQSFYNSYRLGAGDIIGIFVDKHPEDSVPRVAVSPVGQVYYPLMGNVNVAGKTLNQLQEYFTTTISEFIRDPKVTVSLLEAQSAKYGILGDIRDPGVKIMTRPMRVFDAITSAGGITETGNSSNVTVLRQDAFGGVQTFKVNVKKMMQGKAGAEDNFFLQTGDTIIVHGNLYKSITKITNVMGITGFASLLFRGGR